MDWKENEGKMEEERDVQGGRKGGWKEGKKIRIQELMTSKHLVMNTAGR